MKENLNPCSGVRSVNYSWENIVKMAGICSNAINAVITSEDMEDMIILMILICCHYNVVTVTTIQKWIKININYFFHCKPLQLNATENLWHLSYGNNGSFSFQDFFLFPFLPKSFSNVTFSSVWSSSPLVQPYGLSLWCFLLNIQRIPSGLTFGWASEKISFWLKVAIIKL